MNIVELIKKVLRFGQTPPLPNGLRFGKNTEQEASQDLFL